MPAVGVHNGDSTAERRCTNEYDERLKAQFTYDKRFQKHRVQRLPALCYYSSATVARSVFSRNEIHNGHWRLPRVCCLLAFVPPPARHFRHSQLFRLLRRRALHCLRTLAEARCTESRTRSHTVHIHAHIGELQKQAIGEGYMTLFASDFSIWFLHLST